MSTALSLGPGDHGRPVTFDEFLSSEYESGCRYELIHGRLYVSPAPNLGHDWIVDHACSELLMYAKRRPDVVNRISQRARVFVGTELDLTAPEPDLAVYHDFPLDRQPSINWEDVSPLIVVEVMSRDDVEKDLDRNVELYRKVPSIQEYWVFDIRNLADSPILLAHQRLGDTWHVAAFDADDVYVTDLLPEFQLPVRPTHR